MDRFIELMLSMASGYHSFLPCFIISCFDMYAKHIHFKESSHAIVQTLIKRSLYQFMRQMLSRSRVFEIEVEGQYLGSDQKHEQGYHELTLY